MENLFLSNVCNQLCIKVLRQNQCSHCNIFLCAFSEQKLGFCIVVLFSKCYTNTPRILYEVLKLGLKFFNCFLRKYFQCPDIHIEKIQHSKCCLKYCKGNLTSLIQLSSLYYYSAAYIMHIYGRKNVYVWKTTRERKGEVLVLTHAHRHTCFVLCLLQSSSFCLCGI